ncbi:hypothetical protein [Antrihabitans stalactiti]|uniref:Uncharacterized protein n=1 Tax=Antrihabitans stalactiti TaxID=2584121 RepID=A0A848KJ64_9NOCA|nr:hypothetical protein [Antrihabitans stalactiti]NMN98319.1 hypothetical protein [Antrihabitans stalactiti]
MELFVLVAAIPVLAVLGVLMIVVLFWVEMRRMATDSDPSGQVMEHSVGRPESQTLRALAVDAGGHTDGRD